MFFFCLCVCVQPSYFEWQASEEQERTQTEDTKEIGAIKEEKKTNMYKTNDYIAEATDSLICCYSTVKDQLGKDTGCFSFEPTAIIQNEEKSYIAFGTAS